MLALIENARQLHNRKNRRINLNIAEAEIMDAIKVLEGGRLHFDDAVPMFRRALKQPGRGRLANAAGSLQLARDSMINR